MYAQTIEIQCFFPETERNEFRWYMQAMEKNEQGPGQELTKENDGLFRMTIDTASDGLYKLYGTDKKVQVMLPVYLKENKLLKFEKKENTLMLNGDPDNRALSAYNAFLYQASRKLWNEGKDMTTDQLLQFLKSYDKEADKVMKANACSEEVKQYLELWAYTAAYADCEKLDFITRKPKKEIGFTAIDFLQAPEKMLDRPEARYFYPSNQIIMSRLPVGGVEKRLDYLHDNYKCEAVVGAVEESILYLYLNNFNYDENYEWGYEEMKKLTEKFYLKKDYLKQFERRRFARKGASFPDQVVLMDKDGKEVNFDQFKGYYVYVDVWASWCRPCCNEVPHLQKLEQTLQNKQVKFVSISTDTKVNAWKNKMKALNMEGHQLIDKDKKFGEALNITGIPHFLIYDKEGKLLYYRAPRPSQTEELITILNELK